MYEYSNWKYSQQLMGAMDASLGTPILSTGSKPRMIFQLSCYNVGNTASSEMGVFVIPATAGLGIDGNGQVVVDDTAYSYGKVDTNLGGLTAQIPMQFAPWGTKGTTNGAWAAIIPPNCMVVIACVGTNNNGTVMGNCISAEF